MASDQQHVAPTRAILRDELRAIIPLPDAIVDELERLGDFPRRFELAPGYEAWDCAEVTAWMKQRRSSPRAASPPTAAEDRPHSSHVEPPPIPAHQVQQKPDLPSRKARTRKKAEPVSRVEPRLRALIHWMASRLVDEMIQEAAGMESQPQTEGAGEEKPRTRQRTRPDESAAP